MRKDYGVSTSVTDTAITEPDKPSQSGGVRWGRILGGGGIVVALLIGFLAFGSGDEPEDATESAALAPVERRDLVITVSQPGQIEARNKEIIRSQVRERLNITWIIEEGTIVEPNDVLVRLDATSLEEQRVEREQRLDSARSSLVASRVNLENTTSQAESNIAKAELALEFAELELRKYKQGEYPQQLRKAQNAVVLATESAGRAQDKANWSKDLNTQGYLTDTEAEADAAAARKAELDLEIARGELELLKEFTYHQTLRQLTSDVEQARAELLRVKNKAQADIEKAKVDLSTAQANLTRVERDLEQTLENIAHCTIRAPTPGRVVYAPQGNRWNREEPLGEGDEVRFNQEIIHLPESNEMSIAIKIDESRRDLVEEGMPVIITGPNLPETGLRGKLVHIAEYLDPSGRWNPVKEYTATVDVLNETDRMRTGMSCETQIIVKTYRDVLVVPLQSVVMVDRQHVVYLPGKAGPRSVPVTIGLDNGSVVHVTDGLEVGQQVLMMPPLEPSTKRDEADIDIVEGEAAADPNDAAREAQPQDEPTERPERPRDGERPQRPEGQRPQREGGE